MIPRYTRPELGRLWTDEARMEGWRTVELAACEELPELLGPDRGPTAAELEAIRAASFTVEAVRERELVTEHDVAAFVDVLAESAEAGGRWIHRRILDVPRLSRHSTVTVLARLRGWSTFSPRRRAMW